ncbi:uncharacterized protein LOC108902185 [Lates calcarifer]|uniref:Uncharacterized protein LOC108902185 n=1 Tax=Lates calcarifer TaxID=8187 RepID=A0AAJ7VL50_LATCA|nr:uncharacterized protein LOC108902185 [Lates calcarifer]
MEMVEMLENMEASTLNLLMDIVTDIAESHLKKYFKSDRRRFCLCSDIEQYFPKLPYAFDEQQRVMDEAYKVIVGLYFKHLIQSNQKKLKKCWPDIGETVTEDAELLHNTISDLAPGVQQQNHILLKVTEILDCNDIDAHKITAANMQKKCHIKSEDMKRLLQWKGLSKREVQEVLDALPPDLQPTPDPDIQLRVADPGAAVSPVFYLLVKTEVLYRRSTSTSTRDRAGYDQVDNDCGMPLLRTPTGNLLNS